MPRRTLSRDLWLPTLVVALGWGISAAFWWALVAERRAEILASAAERADEARRLVAGGVTSSFDALAEQARLWSLFDPQTQPAGRWQAQVGVLTAQLPGLVYVAWSAADGSPRRVSTPLLRNRALEDALELRAEGSQGAAQRLAAGATGSPGLALRLPVGGGGEGGWLLARLDPKALLDGILEGLSPGYALRVRWGDDVVFSRGDPSDDPWQEWWRVETQLELPHGITWNILHRPTPELAAARLSPVPHYLLASGFALSLLLAALVDQLRLTLGQSRELAAGNRALAQRGDELERRVGDRTAALEEAVAELRAFNQMVSHDLRSPLGAVLNFASILEEDYRERPLDADGLAIVKRIRRSAARATELLEGLLKLSRAGRADLDREAIDMKALALEIFAQARVSEDDAEVECVVQDLPQAWGDRALIGDVLANLFTNALKYSRGCEKRRIVVRGASEDGECVFEVADNGRGFDMRFKEKLFGMFERLDPDDGVDGTGAGLAIVDRIVRRHGGRVWAEGRPGEGARFFFSLPSPEEVPA